MSRPSDPSRTEGDLRIMEAAEFSRAARSDLEAAVVLTAGWSRRQLLDVALTLALMGTPMQYRSGPLGKRRTAEEMEWSDGELRSAHSAYERGVRDDRTVTGELIYHRLAARRSRAKAAAS